MKITSRKPAVPERAITVDHVQFLTTTGTFYVTLDVECLLEDENKLIRDVEKAVRAYVEEKLK